MRWGGQSLFARACALVVAGAALALPEAAGAQVAPIGGPSLTTRDAGSPVLAMDGSDRALVVWPGSDGTHMRAQFSWRAPGGEFDDPVYLSAAGQDATDPQVAANKAGATIVAWVRSDGTDPIVQAVYRPAAAGFGEVKDLSTSSATGGVFAGQASRPQVAIDSDGNAIVVWVRYDGGSPVLQASYKPAGGQFSEPVDLSDKQSSVMVPRVAFDGEGNAIIVWANNPGYITDSVIRHVTRSHATGLYSLAQQIVAMRPGVRVQDHISLAVDPAGGAFASWAESVDNGNGSLQFSYRPAGGAWSAPAVLSDRYPSSPKTLFDSAGNGLTVWSAVHHTFEVFHASHRQAQKLGPDVSLAPENKNHEAWGIDADVNSASGDVFAAWAYDDWDNGYSVQGSLRPAAGSFGRGLDLTPVGARDVSGVKVAYDSTGNVLVVWREQTTASSRQVIKAAYGRPQITEPPSPDPGPDTTPDPTATPDATATATPDATATPAATAIPAPPTQVQDTTAPKLTLTGKSKQKLTALSLRLACPSEACRVTVTGTGRTPKLGKVKARSFKLSAPARSLAAGAGAKVKVTLPATTRAAVLKALAARKRVTVSFTARAVDAAGNATKRTVRVTLTR